MALHIDHTFDGDAELSGAAPLEGTPFGIHRFVVEAYDNRATLRDRLSQALSRDALEVVDVEPSDKPRQLEGVVKAFRDLLGYGAVLGVALLVREEVVVPLARRKRYLASS